MARKKKYVPKAFESGKAGDVSANIYASMIQSRAWMNLTNNARVLYLYMKLQYYGQKTIPDREQECFYFNKAMFIKTYQLYKNVGGQPYWSWYGFDSRVEWCACFISWCANECGYIDAGVIPKFAGCVNGSQWFKDRGQWADKSHEPAPGTIIFFDWEGDGETDHVGIVQKCENGVVYTVEGNSGDSCRTNSYPVGSSVIYGYGIPAY